MGQRGPAKKPAELERLHGNPGKRRIIDNIKFEKQNEVPKPPTYLDKLAKKEWNRLAPKVHKAGLLTDGDMAAFAGYCMAYSLWVQAEKQLQIRLSNDNSFTFTTDKGYEQQIPEVGIVNNARKNMISVAREFGLTPSARSGIKATETEEKENSIMEFIKYKGKQA